MLGNKSGKFAKEWILERKIGAPILNMMRKQEKGHLIEETGKKLRKMMRWLEESEIERKDQNYSPGKKE
ncbi:MAG: hypothetical protein B5M54_04070 [Candidatus Aminicenantes bacterium 4484_214]|nr:MAG: hypothetical protein B5M54_04070 [Candidatus Aminicenantes bacterium 4484_214]RLE10168.1 MAG: hypothetical protein DRJ06_01520 [Candidatus Aminicenantes bacterium]